MKIRIATLAASLLIMTACEDKKLAKPAVDNNETTEPAEAPKVPAESAKSTSWETKTIEDLNETQRAQLALAQESQKSLGGQLKNALGSTVKEKGLVAGIEVCHGMASELSAKVSKEKNIKIGRTSTKLRNEKNTAPDWMKPIVDAGESKTVLLTGPNGEVGWASPLTAGELCVKCHGDTESLAPDLKEALTKYYPTDQATGFKVGDLRGWFWVEVPGA